jgi:hypothetical protein
VQQGFVEAFSKMPDEVAGASSASPPRLRVRLSLVPELCRFFGIVIRMFSEPGAPHHVAHFHAYFQDAAAVFSISPVDLIAGTLPQKQRRLVEAWAELHQDDLLADWNLLQSGRNATPIDPLK